MDTSWPRSILLPAHSDSMLINCRQWCQILFSRQSISTVAVKHYIILFYLLFRLHHIFLRLQVKDPGRFCKIRPSLLRGDSWFCCCGCLHAVTQPCSAIPHHLHCARTMKHHPERLLKYSAELKEVGFPVKCLEEANIFRRRCELLSFPE